MCETAYSVFIPLPYIFVEFIKTGRGVTPYYVSFGKIDKSRFFVYIRITATVNGYNIFRHTDV